MPREIHADVNAGTSLVELLLLNIFNLKIIYSASFDIGYKWMGFRASKNIKKAP